MTEMSFEQLCASCLPTPPSAAHSIAKRLPRRCSVSTLNTMEQYTCGEPPCYFSPPGTRRVWYAELDVLRWLASGARQSTSEQAAA